jgi:BirA family biotin operon repressor/biotin-[acetyl-CoA-carboxylase] ligase
MDGLLQSANVLNIDALKRLLETRLIGSGDRLFYLPTTDSTNLQAMQMARHGAEDGLVVLTDNQTAGKGRQGRRWVDVPGRNVLSSTLLRPRFSPHLLVMIASLAVVEAIADVCGVTATIKWPNDVLIEERKVAGILIETSHDSQGALIAVTGIGINVNERIGEVSRQIGDAAQLVANATTLETACGHPVSREALIARLLLHIEEDYLLLQQEAMNEVADAGVTQKTQTAQGQLPSSRLIRERWRNQLSTLGRTIQVRQGDTVISGVAEDVNDSGELLLHRHSGDFVHITWGSIE